VLDRVPSVCHNNHPTIHPSIYPGPCSDPEWAGSPSLIPIRACLIPKSALPDLEILVLEALSSVCLFCLIFLFLLYPGFAIRSALFGFFRFVLFLCGSRWSYQRFVSWGIKNLSFVPHWVRVLCKLDCRPTCHRISSIESGQLFLFFLDEGRGKGSSWWTWSAWQSDRLSLDLLPLRCGCPKQFGNCYLEASVEFENRSILTAERNPIWNFQHDFIWF